MRGDWSRPLIACACTSEPSTAVWLELCQVAHFVCVIELSSNLDGWVRYFRFSLTCIAVGLYGDEMGFQEHSWWSGVVTVGSQISRRGFHILAYSLSLMCSSIPVSCALNSVLGKICLVAAQADMISTLTDYSLFSPPSGSAASGSLDGNLSAAP